MTRARVGLVVLAVVAVVALVAILALRDEGSETTAEDAAETSPSASDLPVVADDTWCEGWHALVALQGQYVASPTPENSTALLSAVEAQQELGVPASLDPAGYTELTAVLDDIRASADSSFTPTVVPSEPADVGVDEGHDEHDEHGDHGTDGEEAPFGAWLAEYCAV